MKGILIVFMMFTLFVNIGCDDNADLQSSKVNMNKIRSVQNLAYEAQRISYQMLNKEEQLFIWNDRFRSLVNSGSLTHEQRELIEDLRVGLLPSMFDESTSTEEIAAMQNDWVNKAMLEFSSDELFGIVSNLSTPAPVLDKKDVSLGRLSEATMLEECTCNKNSAFTCTGNSICGEPAAGACSESSVGCGFAWLYPCNGRCWYI